MSYQLFKPERFLCEQQLSSYAPNFKGPTVEFGNPAVAPGIAHNTTIPGRYFLSKTMLAYSTKPGLKIYGKEQNQPGDDFTIAWLYGCPHRCVYCPNIYLCKNYPYISADPKIEEVENSIRNIASKWHSSRPFTCRIGGFGDILALEHLTGWLARLVNFFTEEIAPHGQLRIITRSGNFAPLISLNHRRALSVTIPLVPENQLNSMEPGSASLSGRLNLLARVIAAQYPVRISFGPVLPAQDFEKRYEKLFHRISSALLHAGTPASVDLSVDYKLLSVKPESESVIAEIAPHALDGLISRRVSRRKILTFPDDTAAEVNRFFRRYLPQFFPTATIISA